MVVVVRVTCVVKSNRSSAHECIQSVGGVTNQGQRVRYTQQEAIAGIQSGRLSMYVEQPPGHRVNIIVAKTKAGHLYLKTEPDGEMPNNLLALPECQ